MLGFLPDCRVVVRTGLLVAGFLSVALQSRGSDVTPPAAVPSANESDEIGSDSDFNEIDEFDRNGALAPEGFRYIAAGTFIMGSPEDELGRGIDEIEHEVTLTRGFFLAVHPVTEALWDEVMGGRSTSQLPKVEISWTEAIEFCNAYSRRHGLTPVYTGASAHWEWNQEADGYRLPSEAEWEYACRAGSRSALAYGLLTHSGCEDPLLDRLGWYCGNSSARRQVVGKKIPNEWGLYDMHGNVWEWCWDRWGDYGTAPLVDPQGATVGSYRVLRGGSFRDGASSCRCARRASYVLPHVQQDNIGFRLARSAPEREVRPPCPGGQDGRITPEDARSR